LEIERGPLNYTKSENYIPTTLGAVETEKKHGMATLQDGGIYVRNERSSVFSNFSAKKEHKTLNNTSTFITLVFTTYYSNQQISPTLISS
jgi:hypothetical protein